MYYILNLKRRKFIGTQNISNALAKLKHYYLKKKTVKLYQLTRNPENEVRPNSLLLICPLPARVRTKTASPLRRLTIAFPVTVLYPQ